MDDGLRIDGVVALVTGGNRGLGAAFVGALLARGAAKVYMGARDPATVANRDRAVALPLDVTDRAAIAAAAAAAPDVALLINNAGVLRQRSLFEAGDTNALRAEMDVNVFGLADCALAFAPIIARNAGRSGGAIVNMLSVASLIAFPSFGSYAASKAAAMSLTHSLRWDLRPKNVSVHGVYAGFIDTDMTAGLDAEKAAPRAIADAALDGLEAGLLDIPTDERSRRYCAALLSRLPEIQAEAEARADAFRAAHPLPDG